MSHASSIQRCTTTPYRSYMSHRIVYRCSHACVRAAPLKGKTKMHFTSSDQYPECRHVCTTGQKAEIDCVAKLCLHLHNLAVLQAATAQGQSVNHASSSTGRDMHHRPEPETGRLRVCTCTYRVRATTHAQGRCWRETSKATARGD